MSCDAAFFLIKTPNLLLKTPFYYTINHSFCQYSCSFKANLQLKPRFVDKTHIFSTLFYYFLPKITRNFQLFYTIFTTFLLLLLYYYYIILLYYYYIILLKSNAWHQWTNLRSNVFPFLSLPFIMDCDNFF